MPKPRLRPLLVAAIAVALGLGGVRSALRADGPPESPPAPLAPAPPAPEAPAPVPRPELPAPSPAAASAAAVDLAKVTAVLEQEIRRRMEAEGIPSVSVAVVRGEDVVWRAAYGVTNAWSRSPATPDSIYAAGSTFKPVVATAILQLVDEGKLTLDTPVNDLLKATPIRQPAGVAPITLRHLLTHTSGLVRGGTTMPLWDRGLPPSLESVPTTYEATRAPGIARSYSNAGFAVLARVVEVVSGTPFPDYVQKHVLGPLGMNETTVQPTAHTVERLALPYQRTPSGLEALRQVRFDVYPAGEYVTTATDMARFLAMQLGGGRLGETRILTRASAEEMHRRAFFREQGHEGYGLGFWVEDEAPDQHVISHSGSIPGLVAEMRGDLDARVGIYLLANLDGGHRSLEAVARIAIKLLRGEAYVPFDPALARRSPVPPAWDAYVGAYRTKNGGLAHVRIAASALQLEAEGSKLWLVPREGDAFDARGDDAPDGLDLTFVRDAQGVVTGLRGPSGDVAPRALSDAPLSMDLAAPPVGDLAGAWAGFVKFGGLDVDFSFRVERTGDVLSGHVTLAAQGLQDSPVERLMHHGKEVHFEHGAGSGLATVDGVLEGDVLKGTIRRMGLKLPVEAYRVGSEAARKAAAARVPVGTPR